MGKLCSWSSTNITHRNVIGRNPVTVLQILLRSRLRGAQVTHLPCRSARYMPAPGQEGTPANVRPEGHASQLQSLQVSEFFRLCFRRTVTYI